MRLGWAGLGWVWAVGTAWNWSLRTRSGKLRNECIEDAVPSEIHTISVYPVLEGLGFRLRCNRITLRNP